MKKYGLVIVLVFLTIFTFVFPIPIFILDILLVIGFGLLLFFISPKNKDFYAIKKGTKIFCHYLLCIYIGYFRAILVFGYKFKSNIINKLIFTNIENHFNIHITIIIVVLIGIILIMLYCKFNREVKTIIFENKIVNKNNGDIILINDSSIRELIINSYKYISKLNRTILIYAFIIFILNIVTYPLSDLISGAMRGETRTVADYSWGIISVIGSILGIYIGIYVLLINKKLFVYQKNNIENNIFNKKSNGT
jgi:hypothetical protein